MDVSVKNNSYVSKKIKSPSTLQRISCDIFAAVLSGFSVSPFVTIIDKGITQNASGANTLWKSINTSCKSLVVNPIRFIFKPEFRWIFSVYFSTYSSANLISSFCQTHNINPDLPKFLGVSIVNIIMSISQDLAYAKYFGTKVSEKVPLRSLFLFTIRDCLTIYCVFIYPQKLSNYFQKKYEMGKVKSDTFAQIICPVALQIFSTPLHLIGFDYYNNNVSTFEKRLAFLKREYLKSCIVRMMRILPAFGFGSIANGIYRNYFYKSIEECED